MFPPLSESPSIVSVFVFKRLILPLDDLPTNKLYVCSAEVLCPELLFWTATLKKELSVISKKSLSTNKELDSIPDDKEPPAVGLTLNLNFALLGSVEPDGNNCKCHNYLVSLLFLLDIKLIVLI